MYTTRWVWRQVYTCETITIIKAINKKEILVTIRMELESIELGEISQVQKDNDHMFSLTCGI